MLAIFSGLITLVIVMEVEGWWGPLIYTKLVLAFFNINIGLWSPFVKHAPHTFGQLVKHFPQTPQVVVVARPLLDWSWTWACGGSAWAPTAPQREPTAAETGKKGKGDTWQSHWCTTRVRKETGPIPSKMMYRVEKGRRPEVQGNLLWHCWNTTLTASPSDPRKPGKKWKTSACSVTYFVSHDEQSTDGSSVWSRTHPLASGSYRLVTCCSQQYSKYEQ